MKSVFFPAQSWLVRKNLLELNSLIQYKTVYSRITSQIFAPYTPFVKNVSLLTTL